MPNRFWRQLAASAVSNIGDGITLGALPLLAVQLTNDSRLIAGVAFVSLLPWLVFALPFGVVIDRRDRRRLMIASNSVRTVVLVVLATLAASGQATIWSLYGCLFVLGIGEVLFDSSAQAFLPALVAPEQLPKANGLLSLTETIGSRFVGQPLGAILFAFSVGLPFGFDAVSFYVAAALIASIRVTLPVPPPAAVDGRNGYTAEIAYGLRLLWAHALLRNLALLLFVVNFAGLLGISIFVQLAIETLHVAPRWYGALLALMAVGAVAGGFLGDRVVKRIGRSHTLIVSFTMIGIASIGTGLSPNVVSIALFASVDAFAVTMWNIVSVSLRQSVIPSTLFGRINSAFKWLGIGSMALGALVGGQLAHAFGYRMPFVVGGIIIVLGAVYAATVLQERQIVAGENAAWPVDDDVTPHASVG